MRRQDIVGLVDATVAIFIYGTNNLPSDSFDCGLATEAMSIAALSLDMEPKLFLRHQLY